MKTENAASLMWAVAVFGGWALLLFVVLPGVVYIGWNLMLLLLGGTPQ